MLQNFQEKFDEMYANVSNLPKRMDDLDEKVTGVTRRLDYMDRSLSRPKAYVPSSIHDPQYIHDVVTFYGKQICCLTGHEDKGKPEEQGYSKGKTKTKKTDAEKLAETGYVNAAHLIRTSEPQVYIDVNIAYPGREELNPKSPRAAILLTKTFEVLLDMYLWTLIPADPMLSKPHYVVRILFKKDAAWNVLWTCIHDVYLQWIDGWLDELQGFQGREIRFEETKCPSFRAVSHHAQVAVSRAKDNGWIDFHQAVALKSFSAFSPLHSPAASITFQTSASEDRDEDLEE
jgi:hypothetical protein